ncbi:interactor of constitutive active ROPs 2, chloroplastic-like isoform X1 [Andrographis paniculata]|uniref:interactor of constitutive active ROPs 2, chloroplastic-like isoform X1 n=1 Tax=Andrographis paniculata TaxID=175694 RepID=UPI0021E7F131|nr:interactor of constitutive active ROPs 2, chloroplastic-like isoform X1 [Andrographis paniculata]XP_051114046.1 interactor of constitutive active ROPs 2, chloroplastic-like isoform X1 [Andrographis paniculata]XP_051114047.1 interactor of constitutive active ROPs 2, chloroplastic-like isoform X1 [Andrographis paniculata]XP_051114048.1 interactor of constitutive active ROPs 2, chloroplastic-like isoform X1 [Andrographis paniculata]
MQNPKSRPGSLELPQKQSPSTPNTGRKLRTPGSDCKSGSSPNMASKTSKERSPRVDRQSPRSPATEKKRLGRVSELGSQLANLQEELKRAKDQLSSSESSKAKAEQEAEAAKNELASMLAKLDEAQKQLNELSNSEEARVQELRKISQDRDRAWKSELEAVQNQHSMDSAALASALSEIQRLKIQLDKISESEASQAQQVEMARAEIESMRLKITEMNELIGNLKIQLNDSRESEGRLLEELSRVQIQVGVVKTAEEALLSEHARAIKSYQSVVLELEQSKTKVNSLEELVRDLRADLADNEKSDPSKIELDKLRLEVSQLKDALEDAEKRRRDETLQGDLQIRNAYELVERAKIESCEREADLAAKLKESRDEVEELKTALIQKEDAIQIISRENAQIREAEQNKISELKNTESVLQDLKTSLLDKEMRLQSVTDENEILKSEIAVERNDEALEAARAAEQDALKKITYLTEEAEKSSKKAACFAEQLDATQAANAEIEAELRKLKVQSDQWRKAAEAAATMLSTAGNNGKVSERSRQVDRFNTIGGKLGSPYLEDVVDDEDSPKKKNGSMLKKIGVLLKKSQK